MALFKAELASLNMGSMNFGLYPMLDRFTEFGLEDSLWLGPGQLATSNAEHVTRIRTVLEALNFEVATPDEARHMLQLKGRDNVGF